MPYVESLENRVDYLEHQVHVLLAVILCICPPDDLHSKFKQVCDMVGEAAYSDKPPYRYHESFENRALETVCDAVMRNASLLMGDDKSQ